MRVIERFINEKRLKLSSKRNGGMKMVSEAERKKILEIAEKRGVDESDIIDEAVKNYLTKHQ